MQPFFFIDPNKAFVQEKTLTMTQFSHDEHIHVHQQVLVITFEVPELIYTSIR